MSDIKFTATREESEIISKIARRASEMDHRYPLTDYCLDIEACHCNGCPLDLERLLKADDFNFAHDVFQIRSHLNRKTGKLVDCFLPRMALPRKRKKGKVGLK